MFEVFEIRHCPEERRDKARLDESSKGLLGSKPPLLSCCFEAAGSPMDREGFFCALFWLGTESEVESTVCAVARDNLREPASVSVFNFGGPAHHQ